MSIASRAPSRLESSPAIARSTASESSATASESSGARYRIASDGASTEPETVHSELGTSAEPTSAPAANAAHITGASDSTRSRSEEHTSELQSLMRISYAVFCLTKKHNTTKYKEY